MRSNISMDIICQEDRKNIKNIYVHKINSLMKLSKDTLLKEDFDNSNNHQKKKFKKISSQVDKNTLKLQKNRQSAKKARLRKKIYIKMLESQIQCFKKLQYEGEALNVQSEKFISFKNRFLNNQKIQIDNNQISQQIQHDVNVQKFLSGSNLNQVLDIESKSFEKKLIQRDNTIQQLYQLSTSSLIKKLGRTKSFEIFQPVLKTQAKNNMRTFENLVTRISFHYDNIKNSFKKVHDITQKTKILTRNCKNDAFQNFQLNKHLGQMTSISKFMEKLNIHRQKQFTSPQSSSMIQQLNQFDIIDKGYSKQAKISINQNDFNLHQTEKILIRSQKFFQHTIFNEQQTIKDENLNRESYFYTQYEK